MPYLKLNPKKTITRSESISEIVITDIRIDPTRDIIKITAYSGNRSVVVRIDDSNADPEATPPVVGDYSAVIALVNLPAITALLQSKVEDAIS